MKRLLKVLVLMWAGFGIVSPARGQPINGLGTLRTDGGYANVTTVGLSANGTRIVGTSGNSRIVEPGGDVEEFEEAFVWSSANGMIGLGTLGGGHSRAKGISADGSAIICDSFNELQNPEAAVCMKVENVWQITGLGTLRTGEGGAYSVVNGISANGSRVIGESLNDQDIPEAFVCTFVEGGWQMVGLGSLRSEGAGYSVATGISANGSTIVGYSKNDQGFTEAFVCTIGGEGGWQMVGLGSLRSEESGQSYATGISADGSAIIGYSDNDMNATEAFVSRLDDGRFRNLTGLGMLKTDGTCSFSFPKAISANGLTIIGYAENDQGFAEAFVCKSVESEFGPLVGLGTLRKDGGFATSFPKAISADGSTIVGDSVHDEDLPRAFVWTEAQGMVGQGWLRSDGSYGYSTAAGISADGSTIVGQSFNDQGFFEAFQREPALEADTSPPEITSLAANPNEIWPPNGKMVPVTVTASATDDSGIAPTCRIVRVTCNEEFSPDDIVITGRLTLDLRAFRLGTNPGRIYTITVRCTDGTDNHIDAVVVVSVSHDMGQQ